MRAMYNSTQNDSDKNVPKIPLLVQRRHKVCSQGQVDKGSLGDSTTCLRINNTERLENLIHCTFTSTFLFCYFLRFFFSFYTWFYQIRIVLKLINLTLIGTGSLDQGEPGSRSILHSPDFLQWSLTIRYRLISYTIHGLYRCLILQYGMQSADSKVCWQDIM